MSKKTKTFNVTDHSMVPQHIKLSDEEKEQFLKDNNLTLQDMPKIQSSDPALEGIEVVSGDIIRIERASSTAGRSIFYRGVIDE